MNYDFIKERFEERNSFLSKLFEEKWKVANDLPSEFSDIYLCSESSSSYF